MKIKAVKDVVYQVLYSHPGFDNPFNLDPPLSLDERCRRLAEDITLAVVAEIKKEAK